MIELKRCPFCDGEAGVLHGGLAFKATVECKDCGARVDVISDKNDPVLLAAMKWNRRSDSHSAYCERKMRIENQCQQEGQ